MDFIKEFSICVKRKSFAMFQSKEVFFYKKIIREIKGFTWLPSLQHFGSSVKTCYQLLRQSFQLNMTLERIICTVTMVYKIWLLLEQENMYFRKVLLRGIWKYSANGKTKIIFWNHTLVYYQEIVIFPKKCYKSVRKR